MAYAEHQGDGGTTETQPSYFHCAVCGASARSVDVTYGQFGYPKCPVCETQYGP